MSETLPVIQTAGLTKVFRDFWRRARVIAVKDLNLEIAPGEVFGLLGPNGSGKSTAIKMLLGLLYPTRGRISLFGKAPTDVAVKARIGFLPEESYLYRFLNARETLDYYGRLFRLPGAVRAERIERLLEMVGLAQEADRRVGEYSKGMARRIGLAQALINDPELLILDEPTSGLDPIGTRQIKDVIRDLGRRGKTVLLSSHLLADVEDVCDRVTILYGGRERAAGPTDELLLQQDYTQITTERLSPEAIAKVRTMIAELTDKRVVEVSAPTEPLESFFLRIVRQAQSDNLVTSGARAPGELPEFLKVKPTGGEALVESLVSAARSPGQAEPVEPVAVPTRKPDPAKKLVEQLTRQAGASQAPPARSSGPDPTEAPAEVKPVEADPSVIDALMRPSDTPKDV
ncbi:MAG: ATP-binding cassette domain-containing protein [Phycisphaerae bacterium]